MFIRIKILQKFTKLFKYIHFLSLFTILPLMTLVWENYNDGLLHSKRSDDAIRNESISVTEKQTE